MPKSPLRQLNSFGFRPGTILAGKYEVLGKLGSGWEGEVYRIRERRIGVERAAKFFFPQRNLRNQSLRFYARKLHKLRKCPILIQYHTQETITFRGTQVSFLVSELVEGRLLTRHLRRSPGKRLPMFEALHLLHALAEGMEAIHRAKEYHGDLHTDNIMVSRKGITYEVQLVDMYNWGQATAEHLRDDVVDLVRVLYDALGGQAHYAKQRQEIKDIICGLKRSLILKKFRTAGQLKRYLEDMSWEE